MVAKPTSVFTALSPPLKPLPKPPPELAALPEEFLPPLAAKPWASFLELALESLPSLPDPPFGLKPPPFLDMLFLVLPAFLLAFFLERPIYL